MARQVRFSPALWERVEQRIPERERSAFVRQAVEEALLRRAAEDALTYYTSDLDAREIAEFVGEDPGE